MYRKIVSFVVANLTKESVGFHSKGLWMWVLTVMIDDNVPTKDKEEFYFYYKKKVSPPAFECGIV